MKIRILHISLFILITFFVTCTKSSDPLYSNEGEIHYNIVYIENDLKKVSTDMLPKKMILKYKNDAYSFEIEGFFGLFSITNIINPKKSHSETQLSVLNKKFYYEGKLNETAIGFGSMPKMNTEYTGKTKKICGIECQQILVSFPGYLKDTLEVYYTDEIPINNSNRTTPYKDIDGVLMEFYLQLHNIELKLTANAVYEKKIPGSVFERKEDYRKASRAYIEAVLFKLLDTE